MPDFQKHPCFSNSETNIRTTINDEVPGSPSFCNVILNEELPGTLRYSDTEQYPDMNFRKSAGPYSDMFTIFRY